MATLAVAIGSFLSCRQVVGIADMGGACAADVLDDVGWCLARLSEAGVDRVLVCDLSRPEIAPAKVVRVIIPGLETNNPFYTGPRARLTLLRDLVPRPSEPGCAFRRREDGR